MFIGKWLCVVAVIVIAAICSKVITDTKLKNEMKMSIISIVIILASIVISL